MSLDARGNGLLKLILGLAAFGLTFAINNGLRSVNEQLTFAGWFIGLVGVGAAIIGVLEIITGVEYRRLSAGWEKLHWGKKLAVGLTAILLLVGVIAMVAVKMI